jgi:hypothetical protein
MLYVEQRKAKFFLMNGFQSHLDKPRGEYINSERIGGSARSAQAAL